MGFSELRNTSIGLKPSQTIKNLLKIIYIYLRKPLIIFKDKSVTWLTKDKKKAIYHAILLGNKSSEITRGSLKL